jgi:hypothetical protein
MDLLCTWIWIFITRVYSFGVHFHPVSNGQCRGSLEAITRLITHKVAKALPTIFLHGPISLEFDMFLLVPTLPVLKSLSLKKLSSTYNPPCLFSLDNFSYCLGYFSMFCGLTLHRHMPKESFFFGMTNKFVAVHCTKNHRPNITVINRKMQRM